MSNETRWRLYGGIPVSADLVGRAVIVVHYWPGEDREGIVRAANLDSGLIDVQFACGTKSVACENLQIPYGKETK